MENLPLSDAMQDKLLLAELANTLTEVLNEEQELDLEPFEAHTRQLKCHLQSDVKVFRRRLMKGYEVLLKILSEEEEEVL